MSGIANARFRTSHWFIAHLPLFAAVLGDIEDEACRRRRICELVEYRLEDIELKGAWVGPGALHFHAHALAPVAELPVLEVLSAMHIITDLT